MSGLYRRGGKAISDIGGRASETFASTAKHGATLAVVVARRVGAAASQAGSAACDSLRQTAELRTRAALLVAREGAGRAKQAAILHARRGASRLQTLVASGVEATADIVRRKTGVAMAQAHYMLRKESEKLTQMAEDFAQKFSKHEIHHGEQIHPNISPKRDDVIRIELKNSEDADYQKGRVQKEQ